VIALALLGCTLQAAPGDARPAPPSQAPAGFWEHWGDGRAEVAGYRLTQPRYGELRQGEAVLVTVTEDFTLASRVKSDGGHPDQVPVLKLNHVRDFQTGIYDYNAMTSAFLVLDGSQVLGQPTKLSVSVQEWCGHAYEQLTVTDGWLDWTSHSYFDGEADQDLRVEVPVTGLFADALPLVVRGLAGELQPLGTTRSVPYLPAGLDRRFRHSPFGWQRATVTRAAGEPVDSVLGRVATEVWTVAEQGGPTTTWTVQGEPPRTLLGWSRTDGEQAVLTGVVRTAYWQQHREGDEALRRELGLADNGWSQSAP